MKTAALYCIQLTSYVLLAGQAIATTQVPLPSSRTSESTLSILHINDHHSHLDEDLLTLQLPNKTGDLQPTQVPIGGFARVVSALNTLSQNASSTTLRLHSGDAITGDLYYTLEEGKADASMMGIACFDTFTLGNHEFDGHDAGLKKFLDALAQTPCPPVVLSANVRFGASSVMHPDKAPNYVRPSHIIERNGEKIGLVGVTIATKTKNSSRPDPDTEFLNEQQAVQTEIDHLRAQGVQKIIVQSHIGYKKDLKLAKSLRGVDVIIGGDSHTLLGPKDLKSLGLTPQGPYPTMTHNADGHPVCVAQAWQYAWAVGQLNVTFTPEGQVKQCEGAAYLLAGPPRARQGKPLDEADQAAATRGLHNHPSVLMIDPDLKTLETLAPFAQAKQTFGQQVIGHVDDPLCVRRVPGRVIDPSRSALGDFCNQAERVVQHGGDIQQLVAQALLEYGQQYVTADIALQNGGGVRTDLPAGPVKVSDIYTLLPFKNEVVYLQAYGHEIQSALEDAVDAMLINKGSGGYPYAAGLRWHLDLNQPKGQRFSQLELLKQEQAEPLKSDQLYGVITIAFLADGFNGYRTLGLIPEERKTDIGLDYAQALLHYVQQSSARHKPIERPDIHTYSTQSFRDLQTKAQD